MDISSVEISRNRGGYEPEAEDFYEGEITLYGRFDNYNDAHNTISAIVNVLTAGSIPADQPGPATVEGSMEERQAHYDETLAAEGEMDKAREDEAIAANAREPGKPSQGRKRRTKAEMTEDRETDEAAGEVPEVATDEAPARLGRSKPSKEGRSTRPVASTAPEEEPEISDHDMYGAAGQGAAILGPEEVSKVLNAFEVKRAGDIAQEHRQEFLDEIKNMISEMQG
jgi:hypothetical protein